MKKKVCELVVRARKKKGDGPVTRLSPRKARRSEDYFVSGFFAVKNLLTTHKYESLFS